MSDPTLSAFLRSWSFEPTILIGLALAAGLYGKGLARIWRRAGRRTVVSAWRAVAFAVGLLAVFVALLSPIATFGLLLFSMHMVQHLLLTMVAAPLLLLGAPLLPALWALPLPTRRSIGLAFAPAAPLRRTFGWLTRPLPALGLHTLTVLAWHLPPLYDASLRSDLVHYLQHALMFGTALLFWWPVIQPVPGRRGMSYGLTMLYLFAAMVAQAKFLGGLLTFAGQPIYPHYTLVPRIWGLTALGDQQIAGLIMAIGGFMMLGLAMVVVFFVWVAQEEPEEARERRLASGEATPTQWLEEALGASAKVARPVG